jgi:hypothetical protein
MPTSTTPSDRDCVCPLSTTSPPLPPPPQASFVALGGKVAAYDHPRAETPQRLLPPAHLLQPCDPDTVHPAVLVRVFGDGLPRGLLHVMASVFPSDVQRWVHHGLA